MGALERSGTGGMANGEGDQARTDPSISSSRSSVAISNARWDNDDDSKLLASESAALSLNIMKLCPICATSYPAGHRTCPTHGAVLVDTPELAPGTMIRDCYRIERTLGKGGMGIVYLAEHTLMDELRALKFLAGTLASNPSFVQRFLQEARVTTKLHHPNIAQTYELGQAEDGSFYISMEFVDGPSLRAILEQSPRGLPPDRAFNIVRGVAEALGAAHAKRMVHRDIKPENILLAWTPESEIAKVVDFGIVAMSDSVARLTQTGRPLMTAEYAAPEQWRGLIPASELDGRTDLYSLGCMFYEMLVGSLPFHSESYEGWFEQHVHETPLAPSKIRPELAQYPDLDALVLKLLAKERERRPANTREFLTGLELALAPRLEAFEIKTGDLGRPPDQSRPKTTPPPPNPIGGASQFNSGQRTRTVLETPIADGSGRSAVPTPPPPVPQPRAAAQSVPTPLQLNQQPGRAGAVGPAPTFPQQRVPKSGNQKIFLGIAGGLVAVIFCFILTVLIVHYYETRDESNQNNSSKAESQTESTATPNGQPAPAVSPRASNVGHSKDGSSASAKQAVALYGQKQYAQAAPLFQQACNEGDADSCDYLGWMTQNHLGLDQDDSRAVTYYNKACLGDSMAGCNNLGFMYQTHLGVAQDYSRAQLLYSKACDGNLPIGCENLGKMYEYKLGIAQDYPQAATLYKKACDGGNMDGCNSLGHLYENKLGVEQDYPRAASLYSKACDGGVPDACRNAGWMYQNKEGVSEDLPRAASLYSRACDGNVLEGCNNLGYLYQHHLGVDQNYARAQSLYAKACDGGVAIACNNLGVMYQDRDGVDQDYTRAAALYRKACDGGNSNGCSDLGDLYRTGNGVPKDLTKARALLTQGCNMGNQWGCDHLKQMPQ